MAETLQLDTKDLTFYPESDGLPMADNTKQFDYIVVMKTGLDDLFIDDPDVFVAGNLFWYPVQYQPNIVMAPDVMVVFGRPKGYRGSYQQWLEGNIAPQVVFEVRSPSNKNAEMERKRAFYEKYGVEEYYVYDPDRGTFKGWLRRGERLEAIKQMVGWVSPRLGVRFEIVNGELELYRPNGERIETYSEARSNQRFAQLRAEQERARADQEQQRADQAQQRAEQERVRAEQERVRAEQAQQQAEQERARADQEKQQATQERQRAERLSEKLRELGENPDDL